MGYDQHQQSNSSGTLVAVIGVGLVLAILGIIVVAAVGLFWVRASAQQERVVAMEERAMAEAQRAMAMAQLKPARSTASPDTKLNFELNLDREGNPSVDGEMIDLDELKTRLAKLKDETSNAFVVHINADPDCPAKHIIPVLDVCDDLGDIDFRVMSVVQLTATVASYEPATEWDHFDDGTFSAYDTLTLNIITPEPHAGTTLSITVPPTELPEDSAFRTADTRLTFKLQASDFSAAKLSWGAVGEPTIVQ